MSRLGYSSLLTAAALGSGLFLVLSHVLPPLFSALLLGCVLLYREQLSIEMSVAQIGGTIYALSGTFVLVTGNRPYMWVPSTEEVVFLFGLLCLGYLKLVKSAEQFSKLIESKLPYNRKRTDRDSTFSALGGAIFFLAIVWRIKSIFMPSAILSVTFPLSFVLNLLARQSETVLGELVTFITLVSGLAGLLACAFLIDSYDAARNYYGSRNEAENTPPGGATHQSHKSYQEGKTPLQQLQSIPHGDFISFAFSIYNERGYEVVDVIKDNDGYTEAILTDRSQNYLFIIHRKYLYDDFEIGPYVTSAVQQTDYIGDVDQVVFMTDWVVPEEMKQQYMNDQYLDIVDGLDLSQWIESRQSQSAAIP